STKFTLICWYSVRQETDGKTVDQTTSNQGSATRSSTLNYGTDNEDQRAEDDGAFSGQSISSLTRNQRAKEGTESEERNDDTFAKGRRMMEEIFEMVHCEDVGHNTNVITEKQTTKTGDCRNQICGSAASKLREINEFGRQGSIWFIYVRKACQEKHRQTVGKKQLILTTDYSAGKLMIGRQT
ncbi:hypothetical protein BB559_002853, partial [Furculomyces boomerangus]